MKSGFDRNFQISEEGETPGSSSRKVKQSEKSRYNYGNEGQQHQSKDTSQAVEELTTGKEIDHHKHDNSWIPHNVVQIDHQMIPASETFNNRAEIELLNDIRSTLIKEQEDQIQKLQQEMKQKEVEIDKSRNTLNEKVRKCEEIDGEYIKYSNDLENIQEQQDPIFADKKAKRSLELYAEIGKCQRYISNMEEKVKNMKEEAKNKEQEKNIAEEKRNANKRKFSEVSNAIKKLNEKPEQDLQTTIDKIEQTQKQLTDKRRSLENLKSEILSVNDNLKNWERQLSDYQKSHSGEVGRITEKLEECRQEIGETDRKLSNNSISAQVKKITGQIETVEAKNVKILKNNKTLQEAIDNKKEELKVLLEKESKLDKAVLENKKKLSDVDSFEEDLVRLTKFINKKDHIALEAAGLQKMRKRLPNEMEEVKEIDRLLGSLNELPYKEGFQTKAEVDNEDKIIKKMYKSKLKVKEAEDVFVRLESYNSYVRKRNVLNEIIAIVNKIISPLIEYNRKHKEEIKREIQKEIKTYQTDLKHVKDQKKAINTDLSAKKEQEISNSKQIEEQEKVLSPLYGELQKLNEDLKEDEKVKDALSKKKEELESKWNELDKNLTELENGKIKLKAEAEALRSKLTQLIDRQKTLEEEISKVEGILKNQQSELQQSKDGLEKAQGEQEALKQQIAKDGKNIANMLEEINTLKQNIKICEKKLQESRVTKAKLEIEYENYKAYFPQRYRDVSLEDIATKLREQENLVKEIDAQEAKKNTKFFEQMRLKSDVGKTRTSLAFKESEKIALFTQINECRQLIQDLEKFSGSSPNLEVEKTDLAADSSQAMLPRDIEDKNKRNSQETNQEFLKINQGEVEPAKISVVKKPKAYNPFSVINQSTIDESKSAPPPSEVQNLPEKSETRENATASSLDREAKSEPEAKVNNAKLKDLQESAEQLEAEVKKLEETIKGQKNRKEQLEMKSKELEETIQKQEDSIKELQDINKDRFTQISQLQEGGDLLSGDIVKLEQENNDKQVEQSLLSKQLSTSESNIAQVKTDLNEIGATLDRIGDKKKAVDRYRIIIERWLEYMQKENQQLKVKAKEIDAHMLEFFNNKVKNYEKGLENLQNLTDEQKEISKATLDNFYAEFEACWKAKYPEKISYERDGKNVEEQFRTVGYFDAEGKLLEGKMTQQGRLIGEDQQEIFPYHYFGDSLYDMVRPASKKW